MHDPVSDERERLAHVLWVAGAPNAGKTTLTLLLAGKYDLKIYNADWHHVREHRGRPGGVVKGWDELTMDERWIRPSPRELYERESANWTASFPLVVEDLLALPDDRTIVAEGPALFPWCIAPLLLSATPAIFLLPTAELRVPAVRPDLAKADTVGDALVVVLGPGGPAVCRSAVDPGDSVGVARFGTSGADRDHSAGLAVAPVFAGPIQIVCTFVNSRMPK